MKAFEFVSPKSLNDVFQALEGQEDAVPMGGGTDLLSRMKDYVDSPSRVVYIREVSDLNGIKEGDDGLILGASTRLAAIVDNSTIAEQYPALHYVTNEVGTPQIRNMATLGGNLLQRPRDWYFRNGFGLPAIKDGKNLLREGDNRYASIFMTDGEALYHSPSSLAVALIALGAKATIASHEGERSLPIEDLYRVPKKPGENEHTLQAGEILARVTIPKDQGKNASYGIRYKASHDWPLVSCSVACEMDGEKVKAARVLLYGVAPIPWRSKAAEDAIQGKAISEETADDAGKAATKGAKPLAHNRYKVTLTKTAVKRALLSMIGECNWEEV